MDPGRQAALGDPAKHLRHVSAVAGGIAFDELSPENTNGFRAPQQKQVERDSWDLP